MDLKYDDFVGFKVVCLRCTGMKVKGVLERVNDDHLEIRMNRGSLIKVNLANVEKLRRAKGSTWKSIGDGKKDRATEFHG